MLNFISINIRCIASIDIVFQKHWHTLQELAQIMCFQSFLKTSQRCDLRESNGSEFHSLGGVSKFGGGFSNSCLDADRKFLECWLILSFSL